MADIHASFMTTQLPHHMPQAVPFNQGGAEPAEATGAAGSLTVLSGVSNQGQMPLGGEGGIELDAVVRRLLDEEVD